MEILLSWSGKESHEVALFLREWLKEVLPGCQPWVSSEDIAKGKVWRDELRALLDRAKLAIIVVTPPNVRSPWLFFEAGWIAAKLDLAKVCPYLIGVDVKLLGGNPLTEFQCTEADKADTLRLVRSLHDAIGSPHDQNLLEGNFQNRWASLKRKLEKESESFESVEDPITTTEPPLAQRLSSEARELILGAGGATKNRGMILRNVTMEGHHIQTDDRDFVEQGNPRSAATWDGAIKELQANGLVTSKGGKGYMFDLTREGWAVYDQLQHSPDRSNES